jgi:Ribbon-helix-helix protein, copG family
MRRSIVVEQETRRRGRPYAGGSDANYGFRAPKQLIDQVDRWAKDRDIPRGEAIRRLLEQTLTGKSR